jgi:hypothetical protein
MRDTIQKSALCALLFFCPDLFAQTTDSAVVKQRYYIIFAARPAKLAPFSAGGHAFVTWGIGGGDDSIVARHTYGFFPDEKSKLVISVAKKRPGRLVRGFFKNSSRQKIRQMIVPVDSLTWHQTIMDAMDWDGKGYNLLKSNCLSFMDNLADQAGMDTPRTELAFGYPRTPSKYIKRLKTKNKSKNQKHLQVYDKEDKVCANDFLIVENEN